MDKWTSNAARENEKIINPISGTMSPPFANTVILNVLGCGVFAFFLWLFLRLKVPCSDLSRCTALVSNAYAYVYLTRTVGEVCLDRVEICLGEALPKASTTFSRPAVQEELLDRWTSRVPRSGKRIPPVLRKDPA